MVFHPAFDWFYDPTETDRPSLERAARWLETPEANVVARRIMFRVGSEDELLGAARRVLAEVELPLWTDPIMADQFLRGVLEACGFYVRQT